MISFFEYVNLITILVVFTFLKCTIGWNAKTKIDKILFFLLLLNLISEIATIFLIIEDIDFTPLYNISFILHNCIWIMMLGTIVKENKIVLPVLLVYLLFSILNLLFFEKLNLNYNTFIVGALLYNLLFLILNYKNLQNENFVFFNSNYFLLLVAPVLFFFGFSFMFGFKNYYLRSLIIFDKVKLYDFISYFVNIIYYSLINLYIYKERKLQHDQ